MGTFSIGVDLGGTKILAAAFDGKMRPLAQAKGKTPADKGGDAIVESISALVRKMLGEAGLEIAQAEWVGLAVPAPIDKAAGLIIQAPNLGLKDFPISKRLGQALGAKIGLNNDVVSGIWGEYRAGAARGFENVIGIFIGTGVGGGLILGGKLFAGAHGHAGEVGHMILQEGGAACGCGQYGCMEALSSRTAMAKEAVAGAATGKSPGLLESYGTDFRKYRSSTLQEGLEAGDPAVLRIVERSALWTGVGMANLVNILDPEAIVLGGGIMARFGELYRKKAAESMDAHLMPGFRKGVKVLVSELGDLAVATGAAILAAEAGARP
jgi:glucokinase